MEIGSGRGNGIGWGGERISDRSLCDVGVRSAMHGGAIEIGVPEIIEGASS